MKRNIIVSSIVEFQVRSLVWLLCFSKSPGPGSENIRVQTWNWKFILCITCCHRHITAFVWQQMGGNQVDHLLKRYTNNKILVYWINVKARLIIPICWVARLEFIMIGLSTVSFFVQCTKMQLITLQNFNIQTYFSQFLWFFSLKCWFKGQIISRIHLSLPNAYKLMCFDRNINGNRDVKFLECD